MGKYESERKVARENAEVEQAFRQVTNSSAPKKPAPKNAEARRQAAKKRKIILISACSAVLLLLIALIVTLILLSAPPKDDGRILANVYAGGINLGGKTKDDAKNALQLMNTTLSGKPMVITITNTELVLSADKTGVQLDVDAVVETAYQYGRGGSEKDLEQAKKDAENTTYTIALLPYLHLDMEYIETTTQEFCSSYSSVLTQPTDTIVGVRPAFDPEYPDLPVEHQTLTITMGTPNYVLDADDLYDHILDAYSLGKLELTYVPPTRTEPDAPDVQALFEKYCTAPVDASMDPTTFEVTPEVVGYGFSMDLLQKLIDQANYGDKIDVKLDFLMPEVTAKDLVGDMTLDILAELTATNIGGNTSARDKNLLLSCQAINDYVIKAGEEFSFNDIVGRLTALKGYEKASPYSYGEEASFLGGGVSQTASALYYCALMADLDILERHSHNYAVNFIEKGFDANISWGSQNLRFRNNTDSPIRILATAEGGGVTIKFLGLNEKDYTVALKSTIVKQYDPLTIIQSMVANNEQGYQDGDIKELGITGYEVETYKELYDALTGEFIVSTLIENTSYNKRDEIKISIVGSAPVTPVDPGPVVPDPGLVETPPAA